ncbi:MAG: sulfatase [Steroidobacteraceae bacterium]
MSTERGALLTTARGWQIAALPALALLGIALPLTFATHTEPFLFDFRAIDLLPIYATAWVILAAVALPVWIILTLALAALHRPRRAPFPLLARSLRIALVVLASVIVVVALVYCFETWLGTFGHALRVPDAVVLALGIAVGLLAALTLSGRAGVRTLAGVSVACTVLGAIAAASLPAFGWHRGALDARGTAVSSPTANRPNIVLLTIDALSAQHMSLYGAARPTTPNLAAFAQHATTFDRAFSDGNFTTPGIASILTGTRPWTHRALQLPTWALDRARRTSLPALLRRNGYRLGYVSTNAHAGASAQGFGSYFQFSRTDRTGEVTLCSDGLSRYLRFICAASEVPPVAELDHLIDVLRGPRGNLEYDPRLAIDPALAWLAGVDRDKPIFLWVHLFPPHSPYAAPAPWLGRFDPSPLDRDAAHTQPSWGWLESRLPPEQVHTLEARYDESVAYVDYYAGEFLRRALALFGPNTVVIVTADHGESFAHGYGAHTGPGLYNEIIHVPLIVKLPGQTIGRRSEALAEQVDIAPTLAEIDGLPTPADWEGRSLLGECSAADAQSTATPGGPTGDRADGAGRADHADASNGPPVFSMSFEQNPRLAALRTGSVAVIDGKWKLVHYLGALHYPDMPTLHDELYDLAADPGERVNRAAENPAVAQRLLQLIDAQLARHGGPVRKAPPDAKSAQPSTARRPAGSSRP